MYRKFNLTVFLPVLFSHTVYSQQTIDEVKVSKAVELMMKMMKNPPEIMKKLLNHCLHY